MFFFLQWQMIKRVILIFKEKVPLTFEVNGTLFVVFISSFVYSRISLFIQEIPLSPYTFY